MKFKHAIIPVLIFFIVCDYTTTLLAIHVGGGVESNPMLAGIVGNPILLLLVKIAVIPVIYWLYCTTDNKLAQGTYIAVPTIAGFILSVNNICAVCFNVFIIEAALNML